MLVRSGTVYYPCCGDCKGSHSDKKNHVAY